MFVQTQISDLFKLKIRLAGLIEANIKSGTRHPRDSHGVNPLYTKYIRLDKPDKKIKPELKGTDRPQTYSVVI